MNAQDFAPVPPPLLGANEIKKNRTALPNRSGIYFIWEGPVVAYVGQSTNLAQRLLNHPRLRRGDKISYLCIDSNELFYHEAFYVGTCRPTRNKIPKRGTRQTLPYSKCTRMGYTQTRVRKYADGRWGFDDYSQGKRRMVRLESKEKAEKRSENIDLQLTDSRGELLPISADELAEFREWKANQKRVTIQKRVSEYIRLSTSQYAPR